MPYGCPTCGHATLPPAVHPSHRRFCTKCGTHFAPDAAIDPTQIVTPAVDNPDGSRTPAKNALGQYLATPCDCSTFVPGALWPMATNGDDSLPWVERCDDCKTFPNDEAAAEAIAAKIGGRVMWAKVSGGLSPFVLPTDFPLPAGHPLRKEQHE